MGYNEIRTFTLENGTNQLLKPFNFPNTIRYKRLYQDVEQIRNSIISSMIQAADYNLKKN